jgi:hypothetical protein
MARTSIPRRANIGSLDMQDTTCTSPKSISSAHYISIGNPINGVAYGEQGRTAWLGVF